LEPFVRVDVAPLECRDPLVDNVDDPYRNLAAFASALPDPDRFLFLQRYVHATRSSLQVGPIAELLARVPLTREERATLLAALAFELERLDDGDRAFASALLHSRVPERVHQLAATSRRQDLDPGSLIEGFRTFLVHHFANRRCADSLVGADLFATAWFNDSLRALSAMDIAPIDYDQHRGRWVGEMATYHAEAFGVAYRTLWFEIVSTLGSNSGRVAAPASYAPYFKTPEGVVGDVFVWHGSGAPASEFVGEKATLLQELLEYLPPRRFPWLHDIVLGELVTFLATTGQSVEDRVEWFLHVNNLLDYARRADTRERAAILRAFDDADNLVMNAYAALERIAPKRIVRW